MKPAKVRMTINIRKGDMVRVMVGKDRDAFRTKESRVLSVDPVRGRVTVEHANMIKRHTRPNPSKNVKGGIVEREASIAVANVMLVCPACHKPTRVGHSRLPDGTKIRICRRCDTSLEK
jgi:large subunit ribosomal protein L24